ncbi:class I glutamine amidotransferase-like protein [Punctularia strigosozonata HHB-11173 SS5]|uniref:class I glutamine amidotransferase-like protein n=1 Tax=Punctularia strigosozonata (strain HHB-11173) TaxID=741275 RepID=UPI0004416BCF|nr:class I glutamine amidotransferase-like protein [Punctularia strigosozonata HHB-11173 SS5]EIN05524.1 class I glutamine amidotransferase-like protein [Punctularia strigosozonata HHB-11173 SS5]
MSPPIRLALLVCDTPLPAIVAQHGDYRDVFRRLFIDSLPPHRKDDLILDAYDVVKEMSYPPPDEEYGGVVLTGSAASAYENVEWINGLVAYMAELIETKPQVKIFGICFGHQIISRALGSDCVPNDGKWEVGVTPVELTETGKQLFGDKSTLNIHQMHRDHVPSVPTSCQLLATSSICLNQGYIRYTPGSVSKDIRNIQIFTLQGHPEFTASISNLVITARSSTGVIPKDLAEDAEKRNKELQSDGVSVVGRAIWAILGVE